MTRIISIISGKGGVGKTTLVSNLGAALIERGQDVIVLDANLTTPNLSFHLGIPLYPKTLHDVLKKRADIEDVIYEHSSGLKIVPASLSVSALRGLKIKNLQSALLNLLGKSEIILIDGAAGLGREALTAMDIADEVIVITNPELPAVTDALRTIKIAEDKTAGVVVNRVNKSGHELTLEEIQSMLDTKILGIIPEDISIQRSIAAKIPVVHFSPRSRASREFKKIAAKILGKEVKEKNWIEKYFGWLY